jgi:hypothetical protein
VAHTQEAKTDRQEYMAWLSEIDELSADQRAEAGRALAGQPSLEAMVCLLAERIGAVNSRDERSKDFLRATSASPPNTSQATCGGITSPPSLALLHSARSLPLPQGC